MISRMDRAEIREIEFAEGELRSGRFPDAHRIALDLLSRTRVPAIQVRAFSVLGKIAAAHGNHAKAIEVFDRGLAIAPRTVATLAAKARSLSSIQLMPEALQVARMASLDGSDDAEVCDTLGVVFARAGDHHAALPLFERATTLAPHNPDFLYNLAAALQFFGRFAEAEEAFRKVLQLRPRDPRVYSSMVALRKQKPNDNWLAEMTALFEGDEDPELRLDLGHAIAKTYEDLGDPQAAFNWLGRAKEGKLRQVVIDEGLTDSIFAAAEQTVAGPVAKSLGGVAKPIFVFGLPRTGTTLIERILASHPSVTEGGELVDLGVSIRAVLGPAATNMVDSPMLLASRNSDLTPIAERYYKAVRRIAPEGGHFTDKMPLNFLFAGIIARAFPEAKMVCVRRGAADSCLSIYRQIFAAQNQYYSFSLSLSATAKYFVHFDRLMRVFADSLNPHQFMQFQYEEVITDTESQTRRLLDFCDLPFDRRCLDFHANAAPVATASAAQVRSPIYASSIGRWRPLEPQLGDAIAVLKDAGIALD